MRARLPFTSVVGHHFEHRLDFPNVRVKGIGMARLIIDNLTRSFTVASGEKVQAIKEVNLQIEEQELMTLVGPSGSGKTTLLRLIAGLEECDSGTIVLNGTVLNPVSPQDRGGDPATLSRRSRSSSPRRRQANDRGHPGGAAARA